MTCDSGCPDENRLSAWAAGLSAPAEVDELSAHVETCESCREAFALLAREQKAHDTVTTPGRLLELAPAPVAPVSPGEVLMGKYRVLDVLGAGGMGVVVRARHEQLNALVALKFIRSDLAHDLDVVSRFSREARAASRLKSAHANRVLDLGHLPSGVPFMVMEYLEGETLDARLRRLGPLPEGEVARLMCQALDALAEAHALGIVHRDLKPANLFLQRRSDGTETLSVLDFGVAKSVNPDIEQGLEQTTLRGVVGSPAFMAPEQVTPGAEIDRRADLWAIGCTMQMLLTGALPFRGADVVELAWQVRNEAPAELPPKVSRAMRACIQRCLMRPREARFQTANELRAALEVIAGRPAAPPAARRRTVGLIALGLASLCGLGALEAHRGSSAPEATVQVPVPVAAPEPVRGPPPAPPPAEPPAMARQEPSPPEPQKARLRAAVSRSPSAAPRKPPAPPDAGTGDLYDERL